METKAMNFLDGLNEQGNLDMKLTAPFLITNLRVSKQAAKKYLITWLLDKGRTEEADFVQSEIYPSLYITA